MRCILTSKDPDELRRAGSILDKEEIEYTIERATVTDWSNEQYGDVVFSLWIIEEADVERANDLLKKDPPEKNSSSSPSGNFFLPF